MIVVSDTAALAEHLGPLRQRTDTIAFVPTMGNLHDGHLALVYQARAAADAVVVSIFVNPMQFAAHEDLETYPRTLDDDLSALREAGVDLVLTPRADDIYPDTSARHTAIHVPELGNALCGKDRPGHFDGVCTVVYKLFRLVGPNIAVFGEKDLQQLLIIKKMVADLSLPIDIQSGATQRAEDGLALSSRNQYLSASERAVAPLLWQTLQSCAATLTETPDRETASIIDPARETLEQAGFTVDYLELRELSTLQLVDSGAQDCALFVAARLGDTRLIDNIQLAASS
ncbi:MAG: pantoate--beta-alanine ligase [Alteromonadaceae bacterium]|nr:pantoate--beta-alanine ligase [Alteromonadaceae bacterium]